MPGIIRGAFSSLLSSFPILCLKLILKSHTLNLNLTILNSKTSFSAFPALKSAFFPLYASVLKRRFSSGLRFVLPDLLEKLVIFIRKN